MPRCDLENHPKACAITQSKYKRPECKGCPTGAKHLRTAPGAALPVSVGNNPIIIPPTIPKIIPSTPAPIPPVKKETPVATKGKEAILRRITNEKVCSRGRLTCFCSVTAAQLDVAVKELEIEGAIKSWPKGRGCLYTLPDAADPRGSSPATASNDATVPSKKPRRVNRTSPSPPIKSRAKAVPAEVALSAPRKPAGNGVYAAAIADLEARRTEALDQVEKIDAVLTGLRALV